MSSTFTWLVADLLTNQIIAELPIRGASVERVLSAAGSFQGTVLTTDRRLQNVDIRSATTPGRTALYLDKDGGLIWGGILWSRRFDSESNRLNLSGQTFESYAHRRVVLSDLDYVNVDQFSIFLNLWKRMQSLAGGNIGVLMPASLSGITRIRHYKAFDTKVYGEILVQLSNVINGFDFTIDVFYDSNGNITKKLRLGYPQLGITAQSRGLIFEYPGALKHLDDVESAEAAANSWFTTGSNDLRAYAYDGRKIDQGWPLLEGISTYSDVIDPNTLQTHADQDLLSAKLPLNTMENLRLDPDKQPTFGSYDLGDVARFQYTSNFHGSAYETLGRITTITIAPQDPDTDTVVTITAMPV